MIENPSIAQIDESLIRARILKSTAIGAVGADFQEVETRFQRMGDLLFFEPRIEASLQSAAADLVEQKNELGFVPFTSEKDDASDDASVTEQERFERGRGQVLTAVAIPRRGRVTAAAAHGASGDQKRQRDLIGHFLENKAVMRVSHAVILGEPPPVGSKRSLAAQSICDHERTGMTAVISTRG